MSYGKLILIVGPMFAGKTEELVKEILFETYFSEEAVDIGIFKSPWDVRYSETDIVSHGGHRVQATPIVAASEVPRQGLRRAYFDEVQFFTAPEFDGDLVDAIRDLRAAGVDVFCSGLDMDYLGRAFEVTASLMAEASEIRRLSGECATCGAPATHTARLELTADRILLGAEDAYAPMCARHWFEERRIHLGGAGE